MSHPHEDFDRMASEEARLLWEIDKLYDTLVNRARTAGEKLAAYNEFSRIRNEMLEQFGPPHVQPQRAFGYEMDQILYENEIEDELNEARDRNDLPRVADYPQTFALMWAAGGRRIEPQLAMPYEKMLDAGPWPYLCHATRCEYLEDIGKYGLLPAGEAEQINPAIDRSSKQQTSDEHEILVRLSVCLTFWSPWWALRRILDLGAAPALLLIDAKAICCQVGTNFYREPVTAKTPLEDLYAKRNSRPEGLQEFRKCWRGREPRMAPAPEVHTGRIHPRHIRRVVFRREEDCLRWFPPFRRQVQINYPSLEIRSEIWSVDLPPGLSRSSIGFSA